MNYILIILLIAMGLYDLYLVRKKRSTLSQQYQKLFPTWVDLIILGICLYFLLTGFAWVDPRIKIVVAMVLGHVCWSNRERYEK